MCLVLWKQTEDGTERTVSLDSVVLLSLKGVQCHVFVRGDECVFLALYHQARPTTSRLSTLHENMA